MDSIEKVKIAWKQKFASEIPTEFVTRLECGLSKVENNPGDNSTKLLTYVSDEIKSTITELNAKLRNEEFFFEVISTVSEEQENNTMPKVEQGAKLNVDVSALYAKVNKPEKSKQNDSQTQDDEHTDKNMTVTPQVTPTTSAQDEDVGYEEIEIKNTPKDNLRSRNKLRGSVKDKIKMFERSDSSSGEEIGTAAEGDYARLVIKPPQLPPVSPKPSPASRRRPRMNEYEEISFPSSQVKSGQKVEDLSNTNIPSSLPTANNADKSVGDLNSQVCSSSSQQEEGQLNSNQTQDSCNQAGKLNTKGHGKKPAPPVPFRRSRGGNECINSGDSDALKKTEQLTLQYSEHEPQLATSRNARCSNEDVKPSDKVTVDDIHVVQQQIIDQSGENVEGDYCAINIDNSETSKHVTLVRVTSDERKKDNNSAKNVTDEQRKDNNSVKDVTDERKKDNNSVKNVTVLNIKNTDRELSKSQENLSHKPVPSVRLCSSGSISRSLEEFKHDDDDEEDDDYSHLDYSSFKPPPRPKSASKENMKKLFGRKDRGSITSPKHSDTENTDVVVATRYKSLSSSGSDEDLGTTVQVNIADLNLEQTDESVPEDATSPELSDGDKLSDQCDEHKSPELSAAEKRRNRTGNRVPDYEKWDFQHLLTQTGISVADSENLTDTGSEDDMYDNVPEKHKFQGIVSGQSDDSGVCETSPEETQRSYTDCDIDNGLNVDRNTVNSTSTIGSRISTTSCVTVDGDSVFLQRCDSNEATTNVVIPEDDVVSIFSIDDQLDGKHDDFEETLKADQGVMYHSEQLRMRHLVVKGILESEKAYLHVIDQLVKAKHFLQSAAMKQGPKVIAPEDVTTIFYKMDDFHHIHKEFVDDLDAKVKNWSDDQQIAAAVKKLVVYFKAYEEYVINYPIALETIKKYQRNEETRHLLEDQMDSFKDEALKLEDVLLKPVQRIQTNHQVLHDLIKHTPESHPDYRVLQKALKLSEENLRMYTQPGNLNMDKNQDSRQLVKSGFLVEVSKDKKCTRHLRYVFLFSDVLICTKHKGSAKHKDVYFKYVWSLPIAGLNMHKKGDHQKYQFKESLEDLKNKIGNLKVELREEMLRSDHTRDKRAARNVEKLKKKVQEQEATLVEALPRLPLHLEVEAFRPHTFLFSTDYEREEWREAFESQCNKSNGMAPAQPSTHECEVMINATKLHTQVNGIGTVLLKKDEDTLNGSLNVTIHKMQGLDKPCEVYCCMEMDSYGHFFKKAQTRACSFVTDAAWNEDFELDLDGSQTLRILCYKKLPGDNETDVVIGKCALELSMSWLNSKFNEKTISMNDISITISIRHTPASKTLKRTHSKLRTGIFGVKIENVCRRESKTVPSIVTACIQQVEIRGMSEVGIYRVSGVTSDIQNFKKLFDKNPIAAGGQAEHADIHTITGVLKLYFRELPEPLFTDVLYQSFIQTHQLQNEAAKEKVMLELLHSLPDANYYTVVCIIEHLVRVSKQSSENKMSVSNLATIFGPTLMHPAVKDTNIDPMVQMAKAAKDAGMQTEIVYFFLKLAASGKSIRKSATPVSP